MQAPHSGASAIGTTSDSGYCHSTVLGCTLGSIPDCEHIALCAVCGALASDWLRTTPDGAPIPVCAACLLAPLHLIHARSQDAVPLTLLVGVGLAAFVAIGAVVALLF